MRKIVVFYNLIVTGVMAMTGLINSSWKFPEAGYALMFVPLSLYFAKQLLAPDKAKRYVRSGGLVDSQVELVDSNLIIDQPKESLAYEGSIANEGLVETEELNRKQVRDINRRLFLRLIGTAGIGTFLMSIFTKDAQAAFFGSVPGPGTVAIKDTAGNKIDPAEKQPTDGYRVNEVDDAALPSYYGFVDRDGAWYIAKEDSSGSWRYAKGGASFSTNWTGRVALSYDYFDAVF